MSKLKDHIHEEHAALRPHVEAIRTAADAVGEVPNHVLREMTESVIGFLLGELLPHARTEDAILYRAVEEAHHAPGATRTMKRDHTEVRRLVDELTTLNAEIVEGHPVAARTIRDLRRILYGLHALVTLHFAKEDDVLAAILEAKLPPGEQDQLLADLSRH